MKKALPVHQRSCQSCMGCWDHREQNRGQRQLLQPLWASLWHFRHNLSCPSRLHLSTTCPPLLESGIANQKYGKNWTEVKTTCDKDNLPINCNQILWCHNQWQDGRIIQRARHMQRYTGGAKNDCTTNIKLLCMTKVFAEIQLRCFKVIRTKQNFVSRDTGKGKLKKPQRPINNVNKPKFRDETFRHFCLLQPYTICYQL